MEGGDSLFLDPESCMSGVWRCIRPWRRSDALHKDQPNTIYRPGWKEAPHVTSSLNLCRFQNAQQVFPGVHPKGQRRASLQKDHTAPSSPKAELGPTGLSVILSIESQNQCCYKEEGFEHHPVYLTNSKFPHSNAAELIPSG